jgi:hypothetical protein
LARGQQLRHNGQLLLRRGQKTLVLFFVVGFGVGGGEVVIGGRLVGLLDTDSFVVVCAGAGAGGCERRRRHHGRRRGRRSSEKQQKSYHPMERVAEVMARSEKIAGKALDERMKQCIKRATSARPDDLARKMAL